MILYRKKKFKYIVSYIYVVHRYTIYTRVYYIVYNVPTVIKIYYNVLFVSQCIQQPRF